MKHRVYHIVAVSGDAISGQGVIGKDNQLPWPKNTNDMKFFRATTTGNTVIMGRKTFESIGRRLPERENIVVSRSGFKAPEGIRVASSIREGIESAPTEKVFIIGGAQIYEQTLNGIDGIYLTEIDGRYSGDAKYPKIPSYFKKNKKESSDLSQKYGINISFLENIKKSVEVTK